MTLSRSLFAAALFAIAPTTACATTGARPGAAPSLTPTDAHESVSTQIVTPTRESSEPELFAAGERALSDGRWRDAVDAFDLLLAAAPASSHAPDALYGLGTAHEALGERDSARTRYRELSTRFPESPHARAALIRAIDIHAYLEEWAPLGDAAGELLARTDLELLDRVLGLGAQGLSRIEAGDDGGASHDVQAGLDLVEENRFGESGRTPTAIAQLRFALAEIRRTRSERINFVPPPPEDAFGGYLEARCTGLLDAQGAYTDAMHGVDPHWAAMAGYRVGEMYRTLHRDVMAVPTPPKVKVEKDRQIFFAAMHLRYRVLLEKGLKMMNGTLELAAKTHDASAWIVRAEASKRDLEKALEDEKATLASFPFTEAEMKRALELLVAKGAKAH